MARRYKLTNPLTIARSESKVDELAVLPNSAEPLLDEDTATIDDDETIIHERPVFVPSKDTEVMQAVGLRRQYLRDTGVSSYMNKLTATLLQSNMLPYNPYPGYIKRLSKMSERFHICRKTLAEIQRQISQSPTFVTGSGILHGIKLPNAKLWGLQHILMAINPNMLTLLRNIVKSGTIEGGKLSQKVKNVSMMTSIKGPCVFFGSVYDVCFSINIGVTVLATAKELMDAASRFGDAIVADLIFISNKTDHKILSLQIPFAEGEMLKIKTWFMDDIKPALATDSSSTARSELIQALRFAGLKKQECTLNLILNCGEEAISLKMKHIQATKSYNLLTLLRQDTANSKSTADGLYSSTVPYQALHEGVFIEESEAELYVSTFKRYSGSKSPLQSNLITTIQKVWQEKMAGRQLESDIIVIAHYEWLLERLQNQTKPMMSKKEDSLAIELYRISQGMGVRLENITSLTNVLCDIITSNLGESMHDLLNDIVMQYKELLVEFFDEKSRDLTIAFAKPKLLSILSEIESKMGSKEYETVKTLLIFSKGYVKALSIILVDNALDGLNAIKNTHAQINTALRFEFGKDLQTDISPDKYRHKYETEGYVDIERKVVDMSLASAGIPVMSQVASQAARLQYCIDIRVDEVWKSFLFDCFIVRENPPPNPYPSLISRMREASLKVQLFREDATVTARKFLSSKPKLFNEHLQLYTVTGMSVFGTLGAVSCINPVGFRQVSTIALNAAISPPSGSGAPPIAAGAHKLKCITAISGQCLLFHSASPFLTSIRTEEHCFIKGPVGLEADGALALAEILLTYFRDLHVKGIIPTRAIFQDVEMELDDLDSISTRFQNQLSEMVTSLQPVTVHLLVPLDWRWILVKKIIHLCYLDEMTNDVKLSTERQSLSLHKQVFFNGNDAVEYTKHVGLLLNKSQTSLRKTISGYHERYEWSELALLTVPLSLKKGNVDAMDNKDIDLALFPWRLYHSCFGNLVYSAALNETLAECLLHFNDLLQDESKRDRVVTMLLGYRNCLHGVLSSQNALVPPSLNSYCQHMLQNSAPCNIKTGTAVIDKDRLAATLLHILGLTNAISDSLAVDIVRSTPTLIDIN